MDDERFERHFDFLVHDVARFIRHALDLKVSDIGLTRSQWWVLAYLQRDEGRTQTELAEILDIGRAALGRLVDRLEARGWVERRPHRTDRRKNTIFLTDAAWPIIGVMNELGTDLRNHNLECLTTKEQEQLVNLLLRVKERALESYRDELAKHSRTEALLDEKDDRGQINVGLEK